MSEMLDGGTTLVFVSHSIDQVKKLCDHAVWINKGTIMQTGDVNTVCDAYMASQTVKASSLQQWKISNIMPHQRPANIR